MSHTLTIVGLGPGDSSLRTIAAQRSLDQASRIVLRTGIHPETESLVRDPRVITCDDLYENQPTFAALYDAIVGRILKELNQADVVYAVPGSPVAGELTVTALRAAAVAAGHAVSIIPGVGGLDVVAVAAELDLMADEVQVCDALTLRDWVDVAPFNSGMLDVSPTRPLIITQVHEQPVAAAVKIALASVYPDDHAITVVTWNVHTRTMETRRIQLLELDRVAVHHLTSVVVPPLEWRKNVRSPFELFRIVARLRDEGGCPWDRAQTHESIRGAVIEEAFEVADAIDQGDMGGLCDELGDLLIQVALHAQMADEQGTFTAADVFAAISSKLIRRHPHVFGDAVATDPASVIHTWNAVKQTEPGKEDLLKRAPIDTLPRSMPASLKIAMLEKPGDSTVDEDLLGREIAERMIALARAGKPIDRAIERAYRILER